MRRRGVAIIGLLALALFAWPVTAWTTIRNVGYDGSTTILLNSATPTWKLFTGTGDLAVREIDLHVIGAQVNGPADAVRWPRMFGCWYVPDPSRPYDDRTAIGFVDFLPEPAVNSTRNDLELDFPPNMYGKGYPAPQAGETIMCGWDLPGFGYPPLVGGYGRAHLFYTDG